MQLAVDGDSCQAVIEAGPTVDESMVNMVGRDLAALNDRVTEAGFSVDVQPIPGGARLAWQMPLM